MRKLLVGIIFGAMAGIIDVIPMLFQKLSWDANLSAFCFWIVAGLFIAISETKIKGIVKGIIISCLLFIPLGIIIGTAEPISLIPIIIMIFILGSFLGLLIDKYKR